MKFLSRVFGRDNLDATASALLARLQTEFDYDPDSFIEASQSPKPKDFQLIGTFIQVYCFAEFSARQIIEMIDSATPHMRADASRYAPHDVFPKLENAANRLSDSGKGNLKETVLRAAKTIGMHRQMRHALAHWAVRRLENGAAYLILSKDGQEGKKRSGQTIGVDHAHYGIIITGTLRRELDKLEQHTHNLSLVAFAMSRDKATLAKMIISK